MANGNLRSILLGFFLFLLLVYVLPASAQECSRHIAKVLTLQGQVEVQRAGVWQPVHANDAFCSGDTVRVNADSRAVFRLMEEQTNLQLKEFSTVSFTDKKGKDTSLLEILKGFIHIISRVPHSLETKTPFVNAAIEGTEFVIAVDDQQTRITVIEGTVVARNNAGVLRVASGTGAIAEKGKAPTPMLQINPDNAVQWALHYPPVVQFNVTDFAGAAGQPWGPVITNALERMNVGDMAGALKLLRDVEALVPDYRFYTLRASLFLFFGQVDQAAGDLGQALTASEHSGDAKALQAIIALTKNDKVGARNLVNEALSFSSASPVVHLTESYVHQAEFNLEQALASAKLAAQFAPENGLVRARLAETYLMMNQPDEAVVAATQAVAQSGGLGSPHTILGYTLLVKRDYKQAMEVFSRARQLDPWAPMPVLGIGLLTMRNDIRQGRELLETAVSLAPRNALIRSYMGKAYYEENRFDEAGKQFALAKKIDSKDPTPWFYDAYRLQAQNRSVEAINSIQKSLDLNDNRTIYRDRGLLDQDVAVRNVGSSHLYNSVGFDSLALSGVSEVLVENPANYAAHQTLADVYRFLPKHEIARVNELYKAHLLQPVGANVVLPNLLEANLGILPTASVGKPSYNEYSSLYYKNGMMFLGGATAGTNETLGDEILISRVDNSHSITASQYKYETKGFRENNDLEVDLFNIDFQSDVNKDMGITASFQEKKRTKGDRVLTFFENINPDLNEHEKISSLSGGLNYRINENTYILGSLIRKAKKERTIQSVDFWSYDTAVDVNSVEVELIGKPLRNFSYEVGGFREVFNEDATDYFPEGVFKSRWDTKYRSIYLYGNIILHPFTFVLGMNYSELDSALDDEDKSQSNPKFGVSYDIDKNMRLRAVYLKNMQGPMMSPDNVVPKLEPTSLAGFNQMQIDSVGSDYTLAGVALDARAGVDFFYGISMARRNIDNNLWYLNSTTGASELTVVGSHENRLLGDIFWIIASNVSASLRYEAELIRRDDTDRGLTGSEQFMLLDTKRVPLEFNFLDSSGFTAGVKVTAVAQKGEFTVYDDTSENGIAIRRGSDSFNVFDASLGYRFSRRRGFLNLVFGNLTGAEFKFQDTDPGNPHLMPERQYSVNITLSF